MGKKESKRKNSIDNTKATPANNPINIPIMNRSTKTRQIKPPHLPS